MPDIAQDLSFQPAIDRASLQFAGLTISEARRPGSLMLQMSPADAARETTSNALGLVLPTRPNTVSVSDSVRALWLWPGAWLLLCDQARIRELRLALARSLDTNAHVAVEVSHQYTALMLAGENALSFLRPLSTLDNSALAVGRCARTLLGDVPVVILPADHGIDLLVDRSLARFLWAWLAEQSP